MPLKPDKVTAETDACLSTHQKSHIPSSTITPPPTKKKKTVISLFVQVGI
jgi:hypothetical protein